MLHFQRETNRFNFRCAAVIIQDDHLLIHREISEPFWTLPGGRVEFFETTADTVVREIQEEIGRKSRIERPLWFVENFFELNSASYHEISTIYLVTLTDQQPFESELDFAGIEVDEALVFRWVPLQCLPEYNLKPGFLIDRVGCLPEQPVFIQFEDRTSVDRYLSQLR